MGDRWTLDLREHSFAKEFVGDVMVRTIMGSTSLESLNKLTLRDDIEETLDNLKWCLKRERYGRVLCATLC
jgi:hypothetical protein